MVPILAYTLMAFLGPSIIFLIIDGRLFPYILLSLVMSFTFIISLGAIAFTLSLFLYSRMGGLLFSRDDVVSEFGTEGTIAIVVIPALSLGASGISWLIQNRRAKPSRSEHVETEPVHSLAWYQVWWRVYRKPSTKTFSYILADPTAGSTAGKWQPQVSYH